MICRKKGLAGLLLWLAVAMLAACQSVPVGLRLSEMQIAELRSAGFEPSDEGWEFNGSDKLLFGSNEAALVPAARHVVDRLGRLLSSLNIGQIRVDGHTDVTGSAAYNEQLSWRRASAVGDALIAAGVPAKAITVRGLGRKEPVASNLTVDGRMQNRRVVIVIAVD